jgi:hypothetical protein
MTLSLTVGLLVGMTASLILTPVCYAIVGDSSQKSHKALPDASSQTS